MATHSTDQPIRMLPVGQIDGESGGSPADLRPLIESIRNHGIVHPLLVRRSDAGYALIAGHKRLMAAKTLQLSSVPCLVHVLDDAKAKALAAADNLNVRAEEPAGDIPTLSRAVREVVDHHLAAVRACAELSAVPDMPLSRSITDLVRAHAWRAARLLDGLNLLENVSLPSPRARSWAVVVDDVIRGFAPEGRVSGFEMQAQVRDDVSSNGMNDRELVAGLAGAVLATLPLVDSASRPTVVVRVSAPAPGAVAVEVAQAAAHIPARMGSEIFDERWHGAGGAAATLGAAAARALALRYDGTATLEPAGPGSTLRIRLALPLA